MRASENIAVHWETVTPAMAKTVRESSQNFRKLDEKRAASYAKDMLDGKWHENAETISIDENGQLLNGQHRFRAVEISGEPRRFLIARGVRGHLGIDENKIRTPSDFLYDSGWKNARAVAAASSLAIKIIGNMGLDGARNRITASKMIEWVRQNPSIHESAVAGSRVKIVQPSVAAALHFIFAKKDPAMADEFINALHDQLPESSSTSDPFIRLRATVQAIKSKRATFIKPQHAAALCIKAWNAKRSGATPKLLKWEERESFPEIQ